MIIIMGKMRWIVALCLLTAPLLASAESYWEGSAVLQRGDAAFEGGQYAASNSFAPDTRLSILNLDNGKSTTATVSQRSDGQSDILVFLSPKAADALGIAAGGIARVRVTVEQMPPSGAGSTTAENPYSRDQDVNPGAAYPEPAAAQTGAPDQGQQAPADAQQAADTGAGTGTASAAQSNDAAEDAQILAEAEARHPQKQLFLPPQGAQGGQAAAAEQPAASTPQTTAQAQPEVPVVTGETAAPSPESTHVPMAEAQPETPATPQEAAGPSPAPGQPEASPQLALPETGQEATPSEQQGMQASPGGTAGGEKIALQPPETPAQGETAAAPSAATPPATTPEQPASVPENPRASGAQVVASLPRLPGSRDAATFYVQLGVYATEAGAQNIAQRIMETYPVVVLAPPESGKQIYKVLVGPLNKAESGTLLPLFRFRGFRDAFVRRE